MRSYFVTHRLADGAALRKPAGLHVTIRTRHFDSSWPLVRECIREVERIATETFKVSFTLEAPLEAISQQFKDLCVLTAIEVRFFWAIPESAVIILIGPKGRDRRVGVVTEAPYN